MFTVVFLHFYNHLIMKEFQVTHKQLLFLIMNGQFIFHSCQEFSLNPTQCTFKVGTLMFHLKSKCDVSVLTFYSL